MRRSVHASLAAAIALAALIPSAALAAPAPFEGLWFTCAGIGDTVLTAPGNGAFTPGFIEGTNKLFIPYSMTIELTGPDGTSTLVAAKAAPVPNDAIECDIDTTFHLGGATYRQAGTVIGVIEGEP